MNLEPCTEYEIPSYELGLSISESCVIKAARLLTLKEIKLREESVLPFVTGLF